MKLVRDFIEKAKRNNFETLQEAKDFINSIPKDYYWNWLAIYESNGFYIVSCERLKLRKVCTY